MSCSCGNVNIVGEGLQNSGVRPGRDLYRATTVVTRLKLALVWFVRSLARDRFTAQGPFLTRTSTESMTP